DIRPAPSHLLSSPSRQWPPPAAAPLSEGVVASRPAMVRDEQPVVHVTIDRIEVRAAEPPRRRPEPRRSRPQPSVSLADYLRERCRRPPMSSPLAIGAVSAVLRNLLDNGLVEAGAAMGTTVKVTAVAPDTINLDREDEPPRLNLFLYQVTPNQGWCNTALPSR